MDSLKEPNKDRLLAAYRREKLDRVANFEECVGRVATERILGRETGADSRFLPIDDAIEFARRTHQDVAQCQAGVTFGWEGGIKTMQELERWAPPDPKLYTARFDEYCQALSDTAIGLYAVAFGPFFTSYMGTGEVPIQSFLLSAYEDPEFCERAMDAQLDAQLKVLEAVLDYPLDVIMLVDDVCDLNGYMIPPTVFEPMWLPRMQKLVDLAKQKGVPIEWHCCGKLDPVMPHLIEWGIDCIQPVQASCNDIYALKEKYGDKIAFRGNMNIEGVLAFGTPDEVRADTREHIDRLAGDGGYIVCSSHSIVDGVPPENYLAMIETACEYGRY